MNLPFRAQGVSLILQEEWQGRAALCDLFCSFIAACIIRTLQRENESEDDANEVVLVHLRIRIFGGCNYSLHLQRSLDRSPISLFTCNSISLANSIFVVMRKYVYMSVLNNFLLVLSVAEGEVWCPRCQSLQSRTGRQFQFHAASGNFRSLIFCALHCLNCPQFFDATFGTRICVRKRKEKESKCSFKFMYVYFIFFSLKKILVPNMGLVSL